MTTPRAFELRGGRRAEALDWLFVHTDLLGVLEEPDSLVVFCAAELPTLPAEFGIDVTERAVDPRDLTLTGLEHDQAVQVDDDLLVRPPWVARPADFTGIELIVPRGGAFGSGEHASTQAALRCLHRVFRAPRSVADVGTGSGILLLYAHVRGVAKLAACDVDPAAVAAARELLPAAVVRLGGPDVLEPADCVIANMTAAELHGCLADLLRLWTGADVLVVSGLRAHEVAPLVAAIPAAEMLRVTVADFTAIAFAATHERR